MRRVFWNQTHWGDNGGRHLKRYLEDETDQVKSRRGNANTSAVVFGKVDANYRPGDVSRRG